MPWAFRNKGRLRGIRNVHCVHVSRCVDEIELEPHEWGILGLEGVAKVLMCYPL